MADATPAPGGDGTARDDNAGDDGARDGGACAGAPGAPTLAEGERWFVVQSRPQKELYAYWATLVREMVAADLAALTSNAAAAGAGDHG